MIVTFYSFIHKLIIMKSAVELYVINKVKECREAHDMSQRYMSDCLNYTHTFVNQVEDPNNPLAYNLDHLNEIAKLFKCSMKDFMPDRPL